MSRVAATFLVVIALVFLADAAMYIVLGTDGALDHVARTVSAIYPTVDGIVALPLIEHDRILFRARPVATYLHVILAPLALAIGLLQLWPTLRARHPAVHRWTGRLFTVAVAVSVPAGMALSVDEYGGRVATFGFFGMGVTTLVCLTMGILAILRRDRARHREWMIRTYAVLWSSSVGFRLLIILVIPLIAETPLPGGFREPYLAFIYISWPAGLLFADIYLSRTARA